jgi:NADH-quinone oxidoreductase subunit D
MEEIFEANIEQPASSSGARNMTLNMGPQHPSTHGVLRILLELDGEIIRKARPDLGYLHTGIEKQCEALTWHQVTTLTDRADYLANLSNNIAWALPVEKLLEIEVPAKAQWMRVLLLELTRINSHLVWLGTHALDLGAMTVFFYTFVQREEILKLFEKFSGQRLMTSYIRVGGLALEPPRDWHAATTKVLKALPAALDEVEGLLNANPIFLKRVKGVGRLSLERLLDLGVTGPMIRAAGLDWGIRKSEPYSSYEKFDFRVPTEPDSDVWARYRVRMEEMRESIKIVQQALDGMPEGPYVAQAPHFILPEREQMKTQMESLIYHFKIISEGPRVPAGEACVPVESPRGEIAYYVVSDGTQHPYRVFMRTPSFGNLQCLPALFEGKMVADSIASLGSMDFVLGDVDR